MDAHVFHIRLYGRKGCCLCDDVEARIRWVGRETPLRLELVDITTDPALEEKYMLTIPVVEIDGEEAFVSVTGIMTEEELREELARRKRR
ncbi:glutaredoxin family protein [Brevibacillus sp. SYP-B805]|uniref:glutaredoxin family protein n=1 Tax=Brevibacillus sp. SYP-B805 TaxID=1578199 RepID=UPI0013EB0D19|nr:glutaredoxin family protein [Brevibacillus sp. SYP-B805]NGQ95091.1 glutaredoxin family protein [Brevibacillus sp. SYP-B805]